MQPLVDFLNHGILPFTGREREREAIVRFWRDTFDASGLRAMLVVGEAGIGKSRLLDETIPLILEQGGRVIHLKIYPESTASIIPILAAELSTPAHSMSVTGAIEPTVAGISAALRRLARLRATLLVIEDAHLLTRGGSRDLSTLLAPLAEETISVLALARPVELEARPALERYLVSELELDGLSTKECAEIWASMTGMTPPADISSMLHGVTSGNPLALRSALRGTIGNADDAGRPSTSNTAALRRTLRRNVALLAEGMLSHLSDEEITAARDLAALGEVFSLEGAAELIEEHEATIETLRFKGVVATTSTSLAALDDFESAHPPLAFTHTLLHRELVDHGVIDPNRLVHVVASRAPLYSFVPIRLIVERREMLAPPPADAIPAVERLTYMAGLLNKTSRWQMKDVALDAAGSIVEHATGLSAAERDHVAWELLRNRVGTADREPYEAIREMMDRVLERTSALSTFTDAEHRIGFLGMKISKHPESAAECLAEVDRALDRYPRLTTSAWYGMFIGNYSSALFALQSDAAFADCQRRIELALAHPDIAPDLRNVMMQSAATFLGRGTPHDEADYQERARKLESMKETGSKVLRAYASIVHASLRFSTGRFDAAVADLQWTAAFYQDVGYVEMVENSQFYLICAKAPYVESITWMEQECRAFLERLPSDHRSVWAPRIAGRLVQQGLIRDDMGLIERTITTYPTVVLDMLSVYLVIGRTEGLDRFIAPERVDLSATAARYLLDPTAANADALVKTVVESLDGPIVILDDVFSLSVIDRMLTAAADLPEGKRLRSELRKSMSALLERALEWLAHEERKLYPTILSFVDRFESLLKPKSAAAWRARAEQMREARAGTRNGEKLRVTLLGTITARRNGSEPQRFQGGRIRMLMAMMVINRMLDRPLPAAEFARLVAGGEADREGARNIVKNSVHRLRESIGHEAISTDGETPRFDESIVEVDLLVVHALLEGAREALRRGVPAQSARSFVQALEILRGEVAFPSLYDDFIEAARGDLEERVRSIAIDLTRALRHAGGDEDAEALLRRAIDTLPGDGELADMLREILVARGKRAEAAVVASSP